MRRSGVLLLASMFLLNTAAKVVPGFGLSARSFFTTRSIGRQFTSKLDSDSTTNDEKLTDNTPTFSTPWSSERTFDNHTKRKKNHVSRFRQHVNPLAIQYQVPTLLPSDWPTSVFDDCKKSLHVDIGCGKGGFLLDLAKTSNEYNYLGLEIRPLVAKYAQDRIIKHGLKGRLDFVGCNANVDLDRILNLYEEYGGKTSRVTIQFPDPHFKSAHAKRRVVTASLVETLAKHMATETTVFLQSDVKTVLDDMRLRFRDYNHYFCDSLESVDDYIADNVIGVPTERELSVLEKDLPVYRALFHRTSTEYASNTNPISNDGS